MEHRFRVDFERVGVSLHARLKGDFDGSSACFLIWRLSEQYDGIGKNAGAGRMGLLEKSGRC